MRYLLLLVLISACSDDSTVSTLSGDTGVPVADQGADIADLGAPDTSDPRGLMDGEACTAGG